MNSFDEAWLAEHQAKMARLRGTAPAGAPLRLPDLMTFWIPMLLPMPNGPGGRKHWAEKLRDKNRMTALVAAATALWRGREPLDRARVTVTRHSCGSVHPDEDNLFMSTKPLIDCLCVKSKTHPNGLGFIVDDDKARLERVVAWERALRKDQQQTEVTIERI